MFILLVVQVVCYSINFITFAFQLSRLTNELCVPFILWLLIISNAEGETDTALRCDRLWWWRATSERLACSALWRCQSFCCWLQFIDLSRCYAHWTRSIKQPRYNHVVPFISIKKLCFAAWEMRCLRIMCLTLSAIRRTTSKAKSTRRQARQTRGWDCSR